MEISISFSPRDSRSPILPPILPFPVGVLVYWWWCPRFQLFKQVPTFQLFKHQVFFPPRGFLAALFLCSKPVLWFNARRSSIFIFFRRRVLVRNGGEGVSPSRGGRRDTAHAARPRGGHGGAKRDRARAGTEGGAETPTDRTKRLTHSLTHSSSGVWKRRHCDCVFEDTTGHEP